MVRMIKEKAIYAADYHKNVKLDGFSFDRIITEDPERFVIALGRSKWVNPGSPQKSIFPRHLTRFGGPMFRVFSQADLDVIDEWILSLPNGIINILDVDAINNEDDDVQNTTAKKHRKRVSIIPINKSDAFNSRPLSARDLYYYLINIEHYPMIYRTAQKFIVQWLNRNSVSLFSGDRAIPFSDYTDQNLREWYYFSAKAQANSYIKAEHEIIKTREQVIKEATQLCPLILIDGAWLQKWCSPCLVDSEIGSLLYKIYSDEVGNGDVQMNHPNIYRTLMHDMGVELPEFGTMAFSHWDGFDESAFEVPVFWLSISQFPRQFLAETLGLNLAMELSGVGGGYRKAKDELKYYGYNTLFVELHNTIDNVSTGHSAMALKAIELYMGKITCSNSEKLIKEHWERIWIGYRSLISPKETWKTLFNLRKRYYL